MTPTNFEEYYEQQIGEPWSDLERRVLARHPHFAAMKRLRDYYDSLTWWQRVLYQFGFLPKARD